MHPILTLDQLGAGWRSDQGGLAIWMWDLEENRADLTPEWLDATERERAQRFVFAELRRRFVAAHCGLRLVLGRCWGQAPGDLQFAYNPWGKPSLIRRPGRPDLRFSLSHSGSWALLAVTEGRELGADIEQVRQVEDGIAERFFATEEVAALRVARQPQAFHRIWTCKEAVIKATGLGLAQGLDSFAVSVDDPPRLLRISAEYGQPEAWKLLAFEACEGYRGAIALAPMNYGPPAPAA